MILPYREFLEPHFLAHQGFKKNNICNDIVLLLHSCDQTIEKIKVERFILAHASEVSKCSVYSSVSRGNIHVRKVFHLMVGTE